MVASPALKIARAELRDEPKYAEPHEHATPFELVAPASSIDPGVDEGAPERYQQEPSGKAKPHVLANPSADSNPRRHQGAETPSA